MSRFRDADLRGVPVVTKGGEKVGKLMAFVIDAEQHAVHQYVVSRSSLLAAILPEELLVRPSQVLSLDNELMVVEDSLIAEKAEARAMQVPANAAAAPSAMEG